MEERQTIVEKVQSDEICNRRLLAGIMRVFSSSFIGVDKVVEGPDQEWMVSLRDYLNQPSGTAIGVRREFIKKNSDLTLLVYILMGCRPTVSEERQLVLPKSRKACFGGKAADGYILGFQKMLLILESGQAERTNVVGSKTLDKSPLLPRSERCGVGTARIILEISQTIRATNSENKMSQSSEKQDAILPLLGKNCTTYVPPDLSFAMETRCLLTSLEGKRTVSELEQMDVDQSSWVIKLQKQSTRKYQKYWHLPVTSNTGIEEE